MKKVKKTLYEPKVKFDPDFDPSNLPDFIRKKTNDPYAWHIAHHQQAASEWNKLFFHLQSYDHQSLSMTHSSTIESCHFIAHINFKNLQVLSLESNSISSIESLEFVDFPLLDHLDLHSNFITQIKALRKLGNNLETILIDNNPIQQNTQLSWMYWTNMEKEAFWIVLQTKNQRSIVENMTIENFQSNTQSISFMSKLPIRMIPSSCKEDMKNRYGIKLPYLYEPQKRGRHITKEEKAYRNFISQSKVLAALLRKFSHQLQGLEENQLKQNIL